MSQDTSEAKNGSNLLNGGIPKQAQFIVDILKESGVSHYDPGVVHQLLEYSYAYCTERLQDGMRYANHAGRTYVSQDDLKLAVARKAEERSSRVVSREALMEIAREKNSTNLPALRSNQGLRLPPDRYTLSSQNYRLVEDRAMEVDPPANEGNPPDFVDPSAVLGGLNNSSKEFVNPQMIMPTKTPTAPKWTEDDDYD